MTDLAKIPVTVVTGFLGSGKTTLIRHLMQNPGGKRLAVVKLSQDLAGCCARLLAGWGQLLNRQPHIEACVTHLRRGHDIPLQQQRRPVVVICHVAAVG